MFSSHSRIAAFSTALRVALLAIGLAWLAPAHATPGQPGTLDASFATLSPIGAGKLILPAIGSSNLDFVNALVAQPDGKLVLAGYCQNPARNFCAVRLNPDGSLDTGFNATGKVILPVGSGDVATALALQRDGKLVLGGSCISNFNLDFCVVRLNPDGSLDTSFNTTGKLILPVGSNSDQLTALAVQSDGKIVLAGYCNTGSGTSDLFCAVRLNADGSLDTGFNATGKLILPVAVGSGGAQATALALQSDGKIILAGTCWNSSSDDFCAVRLDANGGLDTSFGVSGKLRQPVGSSADQALALAVQPDGKLVLAGTCFNGATYDFRGTAPCEWRP